MKTQHQIQGNVFGPWWHKDDAEKVVEREKSLSLEVVPYFGFEDSDIRYYAVEHGVLDQLSDKMEKHGYIRLRGI